MLNRIRLPILALTCFLLTLTGCQDSALQWHGKSIAGVMPNLEFNLVNENGEAVTADAFRGQTSLVFFGFTHCPGVCPNTLTKLSMALARLPAEQQDEIKVLFVSVDPYRDPPEVLQTYTARFGPHVTGLTGSQTNLRALVKRYRVTYGYGEKDEEGNYSVSHSSAVYVFDREGRAQLLLRDNMPAEQIAADLRQLVEA